MAGTVTVSRYQLSQDKKTLVIKLASVGDSSNGSVPAKVIAGADLGPMHDELYEIDYTKAGFWLKEVWTVAGDPAPDEAGITITDALGASLYTEADVIAASGTTQGSVTAAMVTSALTVTVANQATASAKWDTYIKLGR